MAGGRHVKIGDRRRRSTFWLDDDFIDRWAPWLGRYPSGTAAIACYVALARHAGRDGESWPSVARLAASLGVSLASARRGLVLLELAGLLAVYESIDAKDGRQRSNTYVLLTPPAAFPVLSLDPKAWPEPERRRVTVSVAGDGRRMVEDWRANQNARSTPYQKREGGPYQKREGGAIENDRARARDLLTEGKHSEGPATSPGEETPTERRYREGLERRASSGDRTAAKELLTYKVMRGMR